MKNKTLTIILGVFLTISIIYSIYQNQKLEKALTITSLYVAALEQANYTINEQNSNIDDAKSYLYSTYEDMTYALESLEEKDTITGPWYEKSKL